MFFVRPFLIAALVFGGWLGMKAERFLAEDRCRDAGGAVNERQVCIGARGP